MTREKGARRQSGVDTLPSIIRSSGEEKSKAIKKQNGKTEGIRNTQNT